MNNPTEPRRPWQDRTTRRHFLGMGVAGAIGAGALPLWGQNAEVNKRLADAVSKLEYLTAEDRFQTIGRGTPPPHEISAEKKRTVGLVPETWQLEVVADPSSNSKLEHPLSIDLGTALIWEKLMKLAETKAVHFLQVMACTNGQAPFGMGLWEGVPLRDVIWMARPTSNVRRVFYYGYHNEDPKQRFQSSLTIDRVLEDPPGEQPVILCYKLNGQWLTSKRGGPVRIIVPGAYGNKSVKWLQRIVLTNNPQLNDTYAEWNNDTESQLKTCAFFVDPPKTVKSSETIPITGLAQVGMSGLSRVQYCLQEKGTSWPKEDPHFTKAEWRDARILPPPAQWGGGYNGKPAIKGQTDGDGKPSEWPLRNTIVHWATLLRPLKPGSYELRCRTIDVNGAAQPMPRPLLKSGYNPIQKITFTVES